MQLSVGRVNCMAVKDGSAPNMAVQQNVQTKHAQANGVELMPLREGAAEV